MRFDPNRRNLLVVALTVCALVVVMVVASSGSGGRSWLPAAFRGDGGSKFLGSGGWLGADADPLSADVGKLRLVSKGTRQARPNGTRAGTDGGATTPGDGGATTPGDGGASSGTDGGATTPGDGGASSGTDGGATTPGDGDPTTPDTVEPDREFYVQIIYWNDTVNKPANGLAIGTDVTPPWRPEPLFKRQTTLFGPLPLNEDLEIVVYPEGTGGKVLTTAFQLDDTMLSGSEQDCIHVAVSDTSVRVLGAPVIEFDRRYSRF